MSVHGYRRDWRDLCRDLANVVFVAGYIVLLQQMVIWGALATLVGEGLLIPNAIKTKSWTTVAIAGIFIAISVASLL